MQHSINERIEGRYEVRRVIGRTGTRCIYAAVDTGNGRPVAIKQWQAGDPGAQQAMEHEAQTLERLQHAHIPRYVDRLVLASPAGPSCYLITELIEGHALRELGARGPQLDEETIRNVALQLLRIVEHLERQTPPFVHGSIDPSHVLRRDDGRVYLLGAGAGDAYDPAFAAPERGNAGALGPAVDLFAAAATLAYLATGCSLLQLPRDERGVKLDVANTSEQFTALLERMLRDNPLGRPSSAAAALHELRQPRKRNGFKVTVHVPASIGLLLLGGGLLLSHPYERLMRGRAHRSAGASIGEIAKPVPDTRFVPKERSAQSQLKLTRTHSMAGHWAPVFDVAFDRSGATVASASHDGTVRLWRAADGSALRVLSGHEGHARALAFLPDGGLVSGGGNSVRLWSAQGEPLHSWRVDATEVSSLDVLPASRQVVASGLDGQLRVYDLDSKQLLRTLSQPRRALTVAADPTHARFAAAGDDGIIRVYRAQDGTLEHSLQGHTRAVDALLFSPDGQTLISSSDDRSIKVWSLDREQLFHTLQGHSDEVWALALDPAGKRLASASKDGELRLWDLYTGKLELQQPGLDPRGIISLAFSPDGQTLAVGGASQRVDLFQLAAQRPGWRPPPISAPVARVKPKPPADASPELRLIYEARELMRGGDTSEDYARAHELISRALELNPRFALGHVELGRLQYKAGYRSRRDYDPEALERSEASLNRALELDPALYEAYLRLAYLRIYQKRPADALAAAKHAETLRSGDPQTQLLFMILAGDEQQDEQVVLHARAVIEGSDDVDLVSAAYGGLDDVYTHRADWDVVDELYRSEINLAPESSWMKGNYARFLVSRERYEDAVVWAQAALAQRDYLMARFVLADAHASLALGALAKGDESGCAAHVENALKASPRRSHAQYALGMYRRHTGDPDGAAQAFQAALDDNPNNVQARKALGQH